MAIYVTFSVMKILYVITKSNWGGAQRHVFDLSTTMKEKGHEVWVALGGEGILKQKLEKAGIYTFTITSLGRDMNIKSDFKSLKEIINIIRDKRPDVLHLHSPKAAGLGSFAGRLMRVKTIITTVHGFTFNEDRPFVQKAGIALFSWITMLLSKLTILISDREFKQAIHFPFVKNKLKLIPLGIKPPVFMSIDGAKQMLSKSLGMSAGEFGKRITIGCIAELHPNKGLFYLLDAMRAVAEQIPNSLLVIIGDGEQKNTLQAKIDEYNISHNVRLAGYIPDASEYLKSFTMLVMSSVKEGLPYAILEAGCASLPVVATTVGGIPELVEDMRSGILVQPKNSRELGHAISFMIEHPEERRKYGIALKERVNTIFSLDRMIWLIQSTYETGM